jgi:hypothetical protein
MKCFHRTPHPDSVLENGFRDGEGTYMTGIMHQGVWLYEDYSEDDGGCHVLYTTTVTVSGESKICNSSSMISLAFS